MLVHVHNKQSFQARATKWAAECLGEASALSAKERAFRFLEEALELFQACGGESRHVDELARYVFGRPVGDIHQEIGGVQVTLATLASALGEDAAMAGEDELSRCHAKAADIRRKANAKTDSESPLPGNPDTGEVANG